MDHKCSEVVVVGVKMATNTFILLWYLLSMADDTVAVVVQKLA